MGNPVFLGKTARILLNSQGTHGIHGPLTTLKVSGFPTSPWSDPTGGGLRVHETRNAPKFRQEPLGVPGPWRCPGTFDFAAEGS